MPSHHHRSPRALAFVAAVTVICLTGCERKPGSQVPPEGLDGEVTVERLPMPTDPVLLKGRTIWGGTCVACHGSGLAGAPKITNSVAWEPRIAKGMDVLTRHAIEGFAGPTGTEMPARGGNPDLSDDDIAAAVAFMVENSRGSSSTE